jgi:hypothetical protein
VKIPIVGVAVGSGGGIKMGAGVGGVTGLGVGRFFFEDFGLFFDGPGGGGGGGPFLPVLA